MQINGVKDCREAVRVSSVVVNFNGPPTNYVHAHAACLMMMTSWPGAVFFCFNRLYGRTSPTVQLVYTDTHDTILPLLAQVSDVSCRRESHCAVVSFALDQSVLLQSPCESYVEFFCPFFPKHTFSAVSEPISPKLHTQRRFVGNRKRTIQISAQPSASDSAGQSPTLCALQIHLPTYLLIILSF